MTFIDWTIIAVFLIGLTLIGFLFSKSNRNLEDYFLGGRSMPTWLVAFAATGTSISAGTFVGSPELGFNTNLTYLMLCVGAILGGTLVALLVLPKLYKDMRILLGWAWTYLIVAEVVGTTTGISWFITQQAKYRNFANVYAAIVIIGCIGLACDMFLAWFAKQIFPWEAGCRTRLYRIFAEVFGPRDQVFSFTLKKHSPENVEE